MSTNSNEKNWKKDYPENVVKNFVFSKPSYTVTSTDMQQCGRIQTAVGKD